MKVLKKNGQVVGWDFSKIVKASNKSAKRVNKTLNVDQEHRLNMLVAEKVGGRDVISVKELHNVVEFCLEQIDPEIAGSYKSFRNYKQEVVNVWEEVYQKSKGVIYWSDRENANFLSTLISTKGSLIRGYLTKELYRRYYLSKQELKAIDEGFIYIHDLRDLIFGSINCCLFDMGRVLEGGFEMSNLHYSEPSSVESALQVIGDVTLAASAQQFGGFTIPEIDKILIKYCKKTLDKQTRLVQQEVNSLGFSTEGLDITPLVWGRLERELEQGLQSLEMKLNSVPSSRGDFAFTTLSFGCVETTDPLDAKIQRLICHKILDTRMHGQKDKAPVVFPKLVYLHSEDQHKCVEQQQLFDHVVECCSVAMYPDTLSLDNGEVGRLYKETGLVVSPMGCRAYLSDFIDKNSGHHVFTSRANIGACALNLPMIWKKSEGIDFYKDLDYYLEMIRQFLIKRYDYVANQPCSTNPLAFTQGGLYRGFKKETDKIGYDILESFTASFGVTALNELNVLMEGKPLHKSDRRKLNEVMDYINNKIKQFKEEDGWLYATYFVPAESLAGTQLQQFKDMFGVIEGVSDRAYFSNGFHAHVTADITPFEKQDVEEELFHKGNGGHIQYCRVENPKNLGAIKAIIERGMKMGFYQGINHSIVVCDYCGYRPAKPVESCPECRSTKITQLDRTCGYLGYSKSGGGNRFNDSKTIEITERVSM